MKVLIMRGLPGSGKSTYLKLNVLFGYQGQDCVVCSADDFHMKDGQYQYVPQNAGRAHDACLKKFLDTLLEYSNWLDEKDVWSERPRREIYNGLNYTKVPYLIVDNTNIAAWEIAPYYRLAQIYEVPVQILRIEICPHLACERNTHKVPKETIFRMYDTLRSEKLPSHWNETILLGETA